MNGDARANARDGAVKQQNHQQSSKMKNIITKQLKKFTLALSLGAALFAATGAKAASFDLWTTVSGYGWVQVLPGAPKGQVTWDSRRGCYITDRVKRLETAWLAVNPSASGEYLYRGGLTQVFGLPAGYLSCYRTFTVPADPNKDNLYMWADTNCGHFERRLPIGSR